MRRRTALNRRSGLIYGVLFIVKGSALLYFKNPYLDGLDTFLGGAAVLAGLSLSLWALFKAKK